MYNVLTHLSFLQWYTSLSPEYIGLSSLPYLDNSLNSFGYAFGMTYFSSKSVEYGASGSLSVQIGVHLGISFALKLSLQFQFEEMNSK